MLAFVISQLTGLVAKILIGAGFPAGFDLDAFYAANQPSESLVTIMAGGILVSSFIPVFVKFLVKEDRRAAWHLASGTANLILIIMTCWQRWKPSLPGRSYCIFWGPDFHLRNNP